MKSPKTGEITSFCQNKCNTNVDVTACWFRWRQRFMVSYKDKQSTGCSPGSQSHCDVGHTHIPAILSTSPWGCKTWWERRKIPWLHAPSSSNSKQLPWTGEDTNWVCLLTDWAAAGTAHASQSARGYFLGLWLFGALKSGWTEQKASKGCSGKLPLQWWWRARSSLPPHRQQRKEKHQCLDNWNTFRGWFFTGPPVGLFPMTAVLLPTIQPTEQQLPHPQGLPPPQSYRNTTHIKPHQHTSAPVTPPASHP